MGLLKRGVNPSVYLLVNQLLNPCCFSSSPCPHLAMCQFPPSFPISSQLSFCFFVFFSLDNRISFGVWQVHPISTRHRRCLSSPWMLMLVFKIMWAPGIAFCTRCSARNIHDMILADKQYPVNLIFILFFLNVSYSLTMHNYYYIIYGFIINDYEDREYFLTCCSIWSIFGHWLKVSVPCNVKQLHHWVYLCILRCIAGCHVQWIQH